MGSNKAICVEEYQGVNTAYDQRLFSIETGVNDLTFYKYLRQIITKFNLFK